MSISSIASNAWTPLSPMLAGSGAASGGFAAPLSGADAGTQGGSAAASGQMGAATGSADPFQQLAANIQAMLVQAQTAGSSATGSSAVTPDQQLATALPSATEALQGGQPPGGVAGGPESRRRGAGPTSSPSPRRRPGGCVHRHRDRQRDRRLRHHLVRFRQ